MPLDTAIQPDEIIIHDSLRLRKYDGRYELFLPGYQDPCVYQNSEGIFDDDKIPDLDYVKGMCGYLSKAGELYYIEIMENGKFIPIGDVTVKSDNPPIAIWYSQYRGIGIGTLVMQAVINRLKALNVPKITGSTVYVWNTSSQKLHEKLGFFKVGGNEKEFFYELELT